WKTGSGGRPPRRRWSSTCGRRRGCSRSWRWRARLSPCPPTALRRWSPSRRPPAWPR
ncbi:MAG: hypothetical protein AVDCRST_MAG49-4069, partial [uncultured Thermomicrobiales bacterium]